jgi:inhibitor of KinA sporulation pathway (predicted exonuclease)
MTMPTDLPCFVCVLDFEATCWNNKKYPRNEMEIIEFPSILFYVTETEVKKIGEFHEYVKPVIHPKISEFCTELTGISQENVHNCYIINVVYERHHQWLLKNINNYEHFLVKYLLILCKISEFCTELTCISQENVHQWLLKNINNYEHFLVKYLLILCKISEFCTELTCISQENVHNCYIINVVYERHHQWLLKNINNHYNLYFLTCGEWDLKTLLPQEIKNKRLTNYKEYQKYINIKNDFTYFSNVSSTGMMSMLYELEIPHVGKHHSGIDDTINISNIFLHLFRNGYKNFQYFEMKKVAREFFRAAKKLSNELSALALGCISARKTLFHKLNKKN